MTENELSQLHEISSVAFNHAQSIMGQIKNREKIIRDRITEIDRQFYDATHQPATDLHKMQQLGAQVLWADWMRQKKTRLNRDLAQVLFEKTEQEAKLRVALGKREALWTLLAEERLRNRSKNEASDLERILALSMIAEN